MEGSVTLQPNGVVITTTEHLRARKSELAAVCVFTTFLACTLLWFWFWTLLKAPKKILRGPYFAVITLATVMFTAQTFLRVYVYTVTDADTGSTSDAPELFTALICFYFLLPAVSDVIFIPKILAFFPRSIFPLSSRLAAIAFPVALKAVRITMIALLVRTTWEHSRGKSKELRLAAHLVLNFKTRWPLTECILGIIDETYATLFLIMRMRKEHRKFPRSRSFVETARRFLIASVTSFALPVLFWIAILIAIIVPADPRSVAYLYIGGTFTMMCGAYFSCIIPALNAERRNRTAAKRFTKEGSIGSFHVPTRHEDHPFMPPNDLELSPVEGNNLAVASTLSTKPSSSAIGSTKAGLRSSSLDFPLEGVMSHVDEPDPAARDRIEEEELGLPTISQVGRAHVDVPNTVQRTVSTAFANKSVDTALHHVSKRSTDSATTFTQPSLDFLAARQAIKLSSEGAAKSAREAVPAATVGPRPKVKSPIRKVSTGHERRSITPPSPRRPWTSTQMYEEEQRQRQQQQRAVGAHAKIRLADDVGAQRAKWPSGKARQRDVQAENEAGEGSPTSIDSTSSRQTEMSLGSSDRVHSNKRAASRPICSVESRKHRRELQSPLSFCDVCAIRVDVETTRTIDDCVESLQRPRGKE